MNPEKIENTKGKQPPTEFNQKKKESVVEKGAKAIEKGAGVISILGTLFKVVTIIGIFF